MPKTRTRRRSFIDYWPILNPKNNRSELMDRMFETYGDELAFIVKVPIRHIWTIVDRGGRDMYICAGYHRVNRIGYLVTEEPWENDDIQYKL